MILISHRGNINGKIESYENEPNYIDLAITKGYDVEIDVWYINKQLYLGHDTHQYGINWEWLEQRLNKLWIHCKNLDTIKYLHAKNIDLKYFTHSTDDFTLTNNNLIWTYPGKELSHLSIAVLPEKVNYSLEELNSCYGICSDFIEKYKIK